MSDAIDARSKFWIVWAAFFQAVFLEIGVAFFAIDAGSGDPSTGALPALVLTFLATTNAAAVVGIRRGYLDKKRSALRRAGRGTQAMFAPMLILWALCESVAICGLVTALLTGMPIAVLPFGLAALALLAWTAPRDAVLGEPSLSRRLSGAVTPDPDRSAE